MARAARNAEGLVILYADTVTPSMRAAMDETERRRKIQDAYNKAHGIVPKTIIKDVREILEISKSEDTGHKAKGKPKKLTDAERTAEIAKLEQEMKEASKLLRSTTWAGTTWTGTGIPLPCPFPIAALLETITGSIMKRIEGRFSALPVGRSW